MAAHGAEPALRLALAALCGRWRGHRCGARRASCCRRRLVARGASHRLRRLRDVPARAELDHVERAVLARDEVAAREEDDLARRRQAQQALALRLVVVDLCRGRGALLWRVRVCRGRWRRGRRRGVRRRRRQSEDLVQVERMRADRRLALNNLDNPRARILRGLRAIHHRLLVSEAHDVEVCDLLVGRRELRALLVERREADSHLDALVCVGLGVLGLALLGSDGIGVDDCERGARNAVVVRAPTEVEVRKTAALCIGIARRTRGGSVDGVCTS